MPNNTLTVTITATRINLLYNDLGPNFGAFAESWNKHNCNIYLSFNLKCITLKLLDVGEFCYCKEGDGEDECVPIGLVNGVLPTSTEDLYNKIIALL